MLQPGPVFVVTAFAMGVVVVALGTALGLDAYGTVAWAIWGALNAPIVVIPAGYAALAVHRGGQQRAREGVTAAFLAAQPDAVGAEGVVVPPDANQPPGFQPARPVFRADAGWTAPVLEGTGGPARRAVVATVRALRRDELDQPGDAFGVTVTPRPGG